jgi:putative transposase
MGPTLDTAGPLAALTMALRQRQPHPGLIHHSDRGVQYASADHRAALAPRGQVASISRKGNCYDNATMEAFWSSLKNELVHRRRFATRADARTAIFDYIEVFYNRTCRHSSLGYHSPPRLRGLSLTTHHHAHRLSDLSEEAHPSLDSIWRTMS